MKSCTILLCLVLCISPFVMIQLQASVLPAQASVMAYPNDCSMFQQCDASGCFVMHCGRGTEFNPAISACDYPLRDRTDCNNRG